MSEQKIDRTFNKALAEVAKLQKAFMPGGKLDKAIMDLGGDVTALNEAVATFKTLTSGLTKAHFDALNENQQLSEGVLDEDDEDGFMARSQLYFMAKDAIRLHSMIDDRDDLEPWVQSKIAQAAHAMDAVRRYTEYNAMKSQVEPDMEMPQEAMYEDPSKPTFPITVELAGDSIWDNGDNPDAVTVTDYAFDKDEDGDINITIEHDGPWTIYTDSGFEKAVSRMIGHEVSFSEQGMQRDGKAHLESSATNEAYSPGDENEEGMVSNCCGAPIMDVYQGHGRCSDCKEMASAELEENYQARYDAVSKTANAIKVGKSNATMPQSAVRKVSGDSSYTHKDNPFYQAKANARKNDGLGKNADIIRKMKPNPTDGKFKWGRDKLSDDVNEGKYKSDAQRKAVHAAKNENKIEEGTEFDAAGQNAEFKAVAGDVVKNALAKAKAKMK